MTINSGDNIIVSVKRIKELAFYMNEWLFNQDDSQPLKVELQHRLGFDIKTNFIDFTLRVYYHYIKPAPDNAIILDIQVQNIFEISDFKRFQIADGSIKLPPLAITNIVGLSISHTRALLAKNIAGTIFQEQLLAIINSEDAARHFFPEMF